jgi:hypothetical protein
LPDGRFALGRGRERSRGLLYRPGFAPGFDARKEVLAMRFGDGVGELFDVRAALFRAPFAGDVIELVQNVVAETALV